MHALYLTLLQNSRPIYVVPLRIRCRDREYSDGVDIFASDIYRRQGLGELRQTSLPDFFDVGRTLSQIAADGYKKVIAVHISSGLSGTYNMIRLQGESREDLEVKVFDSVSGALGIVITILQLWEDIQGGMGWRELVERRVPGLIAGTFPFFSVDTLEYLAKGGRIGKVTGRAANMLGLKPMILFKEGEIFSGGVARGRQKSFEKALEQLMNYLDAHGGTPDDYRITVGYGYDADEGKRLWMQTRAALRAKYPGAQCEVGLLQIGCTIAVHTGPYALGMGVMRRWKKQN